MTWVFCECGCGFEGEDDVAQYCIEEATLIAFDTQMNAELEADQPEPEVGAITDPVMQTAMERAKQMHSEKFGVRV